MPIYEYRCASCGFQKEFLQKLSDTPLTVCPECGKTAFNKMVTAAGFHLKGSGWYVTDFKNGAQKAKPVDKSDTAAKADTAGKPEAKADDKPAAKTEAAPAAPAPAKTETAAAKPAPATTPATGNN